MPDITDHVEEARKLLARIRPGDDGPLTLATAASAHALLAVLGELAAIRAEIAGNGRASQAAEPAW